MFLAWVSREGPIVVKRLLPVPLLLLAFLKVKSKTKKTPATEAVNIAAVRTNMCQFDISRRKSLLPIKLPIPEQPCVCEACRFLSFSF